MRGLEIKSRRYEITLTDKTGKQAVVTLSTDMTKWIVKTVGFQGYYKDLTGALKEALAHMRTKIEGDDQ